MKVGGGAKMIVVVPSASSPPPLAAAREKCHNYYLPHPLISKWFLKILPVEWFSYLLSAFHRSTIKSV